MLTKAVLFDDGRGLLAPLTDLRPAFAVRTGALTIRERLRRALGLEIVALYVPPRLEALARTRTGEAPVNPTGAHLEALASTSPDGMLLLINGRCGLAWPAIGKLEPGVYLREGGDGDVVAVRLDGPGARRFVERDFTPPDGAAAEAVLRPALLSRPWHVRTFRDPAIATDLALLQRHHEPREHVQGCTVIGTGKLTIAAGAKVYPGSIFDVESGPIAIDEGAVIRPGCTLIGPVYIGPDTTVLDRALIKGQTAIGPKCKVAGEIGGTVFHGFANKAHDGHLGDSWVGKWANLGAGTTNSNLLNTYGEVPMKATPGGSTERTGQQFMGAIIGDHVKTAICTRIMTGTIIHTGAMIAQTAAAKGCIHGFSWLTDDVPPDAKLPRFFRFDKFLEVARTVLARRKVEISDPYSAALKAVWEQACQAK